MKRCPALEEKEMMLPRGSRTGKGSRIRRDLTNGGGASAKASTNGDEFGVGFRLWFGTGSYFHGHCVVYKEG